MRHCHCLGNRRMKSDDTLTDASRFSPVQDPASRVGPVPRGARGETGMDPVRPVTLGQFTEAGLLVPRLLHPQQEPALEELTQRLEMTGRVEDAAGFLEAVVARERELPTFAGDGVAVPHMRGGGVRQLSMAVGLSEAGIPWGPDARHTVHVVFLFAVPLSEGALYLSLLSGLSSLIRDEVAFPALKAAAEPEAMWKVLDAVRLIRRSYPPGATGRQ